MGGGAGFERQMRRCVYFGSNFMMWANRARSGTTLTPMSCWVRAADRSRENYDMACGKGAENSTSSAQEW